MWKEDLEIIMNEGLLNYDQDEIYLNGKLIINTINIDNFYKSFQINKSNRKDINKIELDFVYNFNKNKFRFDNVKIDNSSNEKLDSFIDSHNFSGKTFDNNAQDFPDSVICKAARIPAPPAPITTASNSRTLTLT